MGDGIGRTHDCKTPDCPNAARSPVGRYAYCDHCRERRSTAPRDDGAPQAVKPRGVLSLAATVRELEKAAKNADKLRAHAAKLTERALEAKRNADAAQERVREFARQLAA